MAKVTTPLKDTGIRQAKPCEKEYKLYDGDGLQLRIKPNGTKTWLFNYMIPYTDRRTNISLGKYPEVSLARARKIRTDYRSLLEQNIDPKCNREKEELNGRREHENTLQLVAEKWIEKKRPTVSKKTADTSWLRIEKHVLPPLGNIPISKIGVSDVEFAFHPIAARGHFETVQRVCGLLKEIYDFAVIRKMIPHNHLSGISKLFPHPKVRNSPSIRPEELSDFLKDLNNANINRSTQHLILWQLYTMVRPVEAVTARWEEIDMERRVWTIPAEKMKMRKDHVVYLSDQVIRLLRVIESGPSREYLFPHQREPLQPASSQTANSAIKRMGYKNRFVAHGMRALASTSLYESGQFRSEVIEHSLAHVESNSVKAVYNRANYVEERIALMQWWSDFIEAAMVMAKVKMAGSGCSSLKLVS